MCTFPHTCKVQTFGLSGRRRGWDDLREFHLYLLLCHLALLWLQSRKQFRATQASSRSRRSWGTNAGNTPWVTRGVSSSKSGLEAEINLGWLWPILFIHPCILSCFQRDIYGLLPMCWAGPQDAIRKSLCPSDQGSSSPPCTLSISGERCRSFLELTPPTERGEKGLLEFATLQGPRHPTLRFGGKRLMEKASLSHPPLGLVASMWVWWEI